MTPTFEFKPAPEAPGAIAPADDITRAFAHWHTFAESREYDRRKEVGFVLYLDSANKVVGSVTVQGDETSVYFPLDEMIKPIPRLWANTVIKGALLVHSHPAGASLVPSDSDIETTKLLARRLYDEQKVTLRDHIIIGGSHSFSFKENGMLPIHLTTPATASATVESSSAPNVALQLRSIEKFQ